MGCGCNKQTNGGQAVLAGSGTSEDGVYMSEIEARAAQIRAGGGGTITLK